VAGRHTPTRAPIPHTIAAADIRARHSPTPGMPPVPRQSDHTDGDQSGDRSGDTAVFAVLGGSTDLSLWRGPTAALEDSSLFQPFPLEPVTTALTGLGFTLDAGEPRDDGITEQTWTLTTPAGDPVADALLLTRPTGIIRRHQALTVQISLEERPLGPASAAIITALTALADRVKARLVSEDLLDDEVD